MVGGVLLETILLATNKINICCYKQALYQYIQMSEENRIIEVTILQFHYVSLRDREGTIDQSPHPFLIWERTLTHVVET